MKKSPTIVSATVKKRDPSKSNLPLWPIGKRDLGFITHHRQGQLRQSRQRNDKLRADMLNYLHFLIVSHSTDTVQRKDYEKMVDRVSSHFGVSVHNDLAFSTDNIT